MTLDSVGTQRKQTFQEALLDPDRLSVTWELIPGRGAFEKSHEHVMRMAEQSASDPRINGITITDNPGGKPAILASIMAIETKNTGIDTIVHFTCKDKNRNNIESDLYALARAGVSNLLVMTGDYPSEGYTGLPKPVFDIDAVHALRLIRQLNSGLETPTYKGRISLKSTSFFPGAVISPFKQSEAELLPQYYKLHKKVEAGARFIITQLGYDARKFDELIKYVNHQNINIPLIGNIFVLSAPVARLMNRNEIPGCVVTHEMVEILEKERLASGSTTINAKEASLFRASQLYAIFKGLGYSGVNISGHGLGYNDVISIISKGGELSPKWTEQIASFNYPQPRGFYYFTKDEKTGLNTDIPTDRKLTGNRRSSLRFKMFSLVHSMFFDEKSMLYPVFRIGARIIDKTFLKRPFTWFEYIAKTLSNECLFCGDCAMHELGFICPMSQCPKQQRNGPCGGSYNEWCEVYPGSRKCIFVTMYKTYKNSGKEEKLKQQYIPPCNWELSRTSSWLNYFNGRDFSSFHE
ncbi:MAG: methylenetetrahydrofolate reductase C-terminal domain-containing protein [Clostridiales bacterium]|nr:methylenetetrahydrofolate reductase C-terminal domain-containing protein [Clostridiales bacterium]